VAIHILRSLKSRKVSKGILGGRKTRSGLLMATVSRQGCVEAKKRHYSSFMLVGDASD